MSDFVKEYYWQKWIKWLVLGLIVVIAITTFGGSYNGLVTNRQLVDERWSQVENVLQMRFDKIPQLVQVVKGYAAHEEKVFTEIADARSRLSGAAASGDINEKVQASEQMTSALSRLLVITESYPDLKADKQFINLQDEISEAENMLMRARQQYNSSVTVYNNKVNTFPGNVFARAMGFSPRAYFEASAGSDKAPEIKF